MLCACECLKGKAGGRRPPLLLSFQAAILVAEGHHEVGGRPRLAVVRRGVLKPASGLDGLLQEQEGGSALVRLNPLLEVGPTKVYAVLGRVELALLEHQAGAGHLLEDPPEALVELRIYCPGEATDSVAEFNGGPYAVAN